MLIFQIVILKYLHLCKKTAFHMKQSIIKVPEPNKRIKFHFKDLCKSLVFYFNAIDIDIDDC